VLASPSAAAVARELGYKTVYEIDHGQELSVCEGRMRVKATQGAWVWTCWFFCGNGGGTVKQSPSQPRESYGHTYMCAASLNSHIPCRCPGWAALVQA
jgi:hypothetical protein